MKRLLHRAQRGFGFALVSLICMSLFGPIVSVSALQTESTGAYINSGDGDSVNVRETVGYDSNVLSSVPDQTEVTVLDGPVTANDGTSWYLVTVWGFTGWVDTQFVAFGSAAVVEELEAQNESPATEAPAEEVTTEEQPAKNETSEETVVEEPAAEVIPWQDPIHYGVVVNNILDGSYPEAGLACRTSSNEDATDLYRYQLGENVEIVGEEFWENGFSWYPVNCVGQGGFVKSLYIHVEELEAPAEEEVPAETEVPGTDVATEEVTEESVTEEATSEEAATEEAATEETEAGTGSSATLDKPAIGSATVQGTNGDGVVCRTSPSFEAEVITTLTEGTEVPVTAQPDATWLEIVCNDQIGYAVTEYLWSGGLNDDEEAELTGNAIGTGTVVQTGGMGVRCRTGGSLNDTIIMTVGEGNTVSTRGAASGAWVPVICGGQNGYIHGDYLSIQNGGDTAAPQDDTNTGGAGTGTVTNTGGMGVRCRAGEGTGTHIITVLREGSSVSTRGGANGSWVPVLCGGQNGFVHADYLSVSAGSGDPDPAPTEEPSGSAGSAVVTGTNGDGVRCRTQGTTAAAIITVLGEGRTVSTRGSTSGGWTPVVCGGQNGYVFAQYLTISNGTDNPAPTPTEEPSTGNGGMAVGSHALVTTSLNLRYNPSMGAGIAAVAPGGTVVEITGGSENGFYKIDWDGLAGYMHGDYLQQTDQALSERGGSGDNDPPAEQPDPEPGNPGTGNAMVDFAMGYIGYPYVWATHGPSSFDCSGFTYWVAKNVLGVNIGTGTWTQTVAGTPVGRNNLQPGDIVFFQNTYKAGLSHVGIYIGNGQFIHAENERTGVKISDLNSSYYGSRWYGAVRLT